MAPLSLLTPTRLLADTTSRTTYELGRLQAFGERWQYLVLGVACAGDRRAGRVDGSPRHARAAPRRSLAAAGAARRHAGRLCSYFSCTWKNGPRPRSSITRACVVLVDTSLSMGLHDATGSAVPAKPNRLEQVVGVLGEGELLDALRDKHDVVLERFDADLGRVASFAKRAQTPRPAPRAPKRQLPRCRRPSELRPLQPCRPAGPSGCCRRGPRRGLASRCARRSTKSDPRPLAGVIVFSDGGQNAGIDPSAAVTTARDAKIPVFTVGIGADRRAANVRVSDLVAPARAYPGDSFTITGYLQAEGLSDRAVTVELSSRPAAAGKADDGKLVASNRVTLGGRGEIVPVKFDITPNETGRQMYRLRVKAPPEDSNPTDDQQEADVEIVDRKTKVLLVASGPTREYTFLRNQLQRDKQVVVDVWLQSAPAEGVSQDAHQLLTAFPSTAAELFEYDSIVAFDPDWREVEPARIDLLERWVAEKAGGLVVVAGPVEMDRWVQDPKMSKVRGLYPVEFNRRITLIEEGRYGSTTPWPLDFTREGLEAEFLWLGDSAPRSQQIWSSFPGVYGYYAVRGAKPGATIFARYSDPEAGALDARPIYMAGQFYGAGRVFYLGSGEMWRLRALDDSDFEQFYTKLIRHVSQGRLLLGSSRGMLLVDRDRYLLGNTVVVRAQLSNAQFEPLGSAQRAVGGRAAGQHQRNLAVDRRSGAQGDVRRPVHGPGRRHLPAGNGHSRERRRTARAAHPGARARHRARES